MCVRDAAVAGRELMFKLRSKQRRESSPKQIDIRGYVNDIMAMELNI